MTRSIPNDWLDSHNINGGWQFQCSTTLFELVSTNRAAIYFRELTELLEHDRHLFDFHLKIRHNYKRNNNLEIIVLFGDADRVSNPLPSSYCISCHPAHKLSRASLLSQQQYTRAWLDGRGRSKLILTPIRHVERLSELEDENGEMAAFWHDAIGFINREGGDSNPSDSTMILNHGTYRNHAHLHLKINFREKIWNERIAPRYCAKIEEIRRLDKQLTIGEGCFNNRHGHDSREYQAGPGNCHHGSDLRVRKHRRSSGSDDREDQHKSGPEDYQGHCGKRHHGSGSSDRKHRHSTGSGDRKHRHSSRSRNRKHRHSTGSRNRKHHYSSSSSDRKHRHSTSSRNHKHHYSSGSRDRKHHYSSGSRDRKHRHSSGSRDRADYRHRNQ